CMQTLDLPTF
nr:immunoglobulin light chain junction region [Macaca mulatta]MOW44565.1 immunoglobulin light chain junction region [Macaca mulatta]MOW45250.1 immunoglobulin light chain junction region [Macaca mulatta]